MIRAKQIPDEVVEAAAKADYIMIRGEAIADHGSVAELWYCSWAEASDDAKVYHMDHARTVLAAALSAWPGAEIAKEATEERLHLILPLPAEASDGDV